MFKLVCQEYSKLIHGWREDFNAEYAESAEKNYRDSRADGTAVYSTWIVW